MTALLIVVGLLGATVMGLVAFTWVTVRRVEAALPPQGGFIDVPGARLHIVDKGQGPPVLLIHGLAGQLCHFTYGVVDRLATRHRVIAVDRPGSGYSLRLPGAAATLGAQADQIAALIEALKLQRPVVVGHSLGGAVALALAQRHPQHVAALALVAPLTHMPRSVSAAFKGLTIRQPWLRRLIAWTLVVPATMAQRDRILAMVFGPESVPPDYGTRGGGLLGLRPSHFVAASTDMAAAPLDMAEIIRNYPGMRLAVCVLYGRGDRILDPTEQGVALQSALPGALLELVDGGHMLPVTAPERTARFILDVAQRVTRGD